MKKDTPAWFLVAFGLLVVILGPLATLFALNTLFPVLAIPYSIWTWTAVLFLMATLKAKSSK